MYGRDGTYQTKVSLERGGDRIQIDEAGYAYFKDTDVSGEQLKHINVPQVNQAIMINSAGVLSAQEATYPPILPSQYGMIVLSMADAASNASARLPSAQQGNDLVIALRGGGSTCSVVIYCEGHTSGLTGASVIGYTSGAISNISMRGSAASNPILRLHAFSDGTWSVVDSAGQITLSAAS
jgi:hypothetical protein